jgi:hypothetical protein
MNIKEIKMKRKVIALGLALFVLGCGVAIHYPTHFHYVIELEKGGRMEVSGRLLDTIDPSSSVAKSFKVSPDSRRIAYAAKRGKKWLVVVDGQEGKKYDNIIVAMEVGKIVWDNPDQIHYLAQKGNAVYLVEEKLFE